MKNVFRFKKFEVDQTGCAMRINTDGVLLGTLAESKCPKQILDIGSGTGVIALMLAQRYPGARIAAVEIDERAALTAGKNFANSPFSDRLRIDHIAIEQYSNDIQFDLIISNPPYFVNDLKSTEEKKGIARHTSTGFFEELIARVAGMLSEQGSFWFILPVKQAELLVEKGKTFGLNAVRQISLHSDKQKPVFRRIVCLSKSTEVSATEHFYIYESEKIYTQAYQSLLKDFFLAY